mmetsp:Transcript_12560/g.12184  ORF Transcript_12560/g.12184 Transcript_12560/m.12184 type:complete len:569 (-) Transcript_12560:491-2197(-)|eukprot:CAMPEP_0119039256 /NCGR_PEP_ID=MMETSP1177-20130426/8653_1 /TAXON_ID=2985 /ORGANISM="Ochromonas sp, Strain CCMP1899" /LENGTH=568 /DNA_ID=CAMNT_0007002917 /DNA_START=140 /DNA_END=1846 /DNA_ORIENTATION=-
MAEFPTWVIGVILVIVGSLGNNLGNNLVSLAHTQTKKGKELEEAEGEKQEKESEKFEIRTSKDEYSEKKDEDSVEADSPKDLIVIRKEKKESCCSMRTIGTLVFVFGNLFTFAAFGFGAQSLLASLESVQFVSNVFFAKYVHKEKITLRMALATGSIVVGNILVVVFSKDSSRLFSSRDILYLYRNNTPYHGYLAAAGSIWVICHFTYSHYYKVRIFEKRVLWQHSFIEPFTFTISSTIIGTQAVLLSKCMSMLIQLSIANTEDEFSRAPVYVILVCWIILVAYWLRRLDVGLSLYPPLFIIPVMQVFFIFFALLCGGIYFEEFEEFTAGMFAGFIVGVILILIGVYGMAPVGEPVIPRDKDPSCNIIHPETPEKIGHIEEGLVRSGSIRSGGDKVRRGSEGGMIPLYSAYESPIKDMPIKDIIHDIGTAGEKVRRVSRDMHMYSGKSFKGFDASLEVVLENKTLIKPDALSIKNEPKKHTGSLPALTDTDLLARRKKRKVVKRIAMGDGNLPEGAEGSESPDSHHGSHQDMLKETVPSPTTGERHLSGDGGSGDKGLMEYGPHTFKL